MTTEMPPPPPKNPSAATSSTPTSPEPQTETLDEPSTSAMAPPPPKNPVQSDAVLSHSNGREEPQPTPSQDQEEPAAPVEISDAGNSAPTRSVDGKQEQRPSVAVPYTIPEWSGPPGYDFSLEVLKGGSIVDQLHVHEKGAYMFGRVDLCDFVLEHPTISRFHAVLQFKRNGGAYLHDLGSTHGTFVNKNQVKPKVFVDLHVGDVIRFGQSSRLYILQGPSELMPPERDLKSIKNSKMREEMQDMKASLLRAKREASIADGVSWGMGEDAIEEAEEDVDEISWQNYKGQLTEKQEKTRDKVIKRLEKIGNMKKEIDAIRAKDISQGGLTQGQQTQIARNEQRIAQIMEELENLEETLNESIQESLGARVGGMSHAKKKGVAEDEEEYSSDEDEFYDRTKKKASKRKGGENQSIETADSLLDKKDALTTEIEEKKLLLEEKDRMESENAGEGAGDALDAYMSGLSSQLVLDKTEKLQNELSTLQSELDRIVYLLKIADPAGEAARKRESNSQDPKPNLFKVPTSASVRKTKSEPNRKIESEKSVNSSDKKQDTTNVTSGKKPEEGEVIVDKTECKATEYVAVKPQWLGAVQKTETKETQLEGPLEMQESDQFVDYKDRKKALENQDATQLNMELGIENAAPGLIIRKRKQVVNETKASEHSTIASEGAESRAEDAVALLLKHKRGYYASDDEAGQNTEDIPRRKKPGKDNKKPKRVLGPERPSFLGGETDYETWVPPEGQSGDGRTSLNERYGY
ncbi:uncharacterized protein LOC131304551 isoform X3 [Rhododendron vialii]|uniref:uncharacterized protein LOC131304551 isoform X3 n=1 Tax=Rhododendron vialii TaxID=182163 RepID=UPI00265DDA0E|nr:uncharacterized protein LOC131304551 isoform X3 [Rhododendron vialii]